MAEHLSKEAIKKVIEGRGHAERVPVLYDLWIGENVFDNDAEKREQWLERYPRDVEDIFLLMPDVFEGKEDAPDYRWAHKDMEYGESTGLDARIVIEDWEEEAEPFFADFPDAEYPGMIPDTKVSGERYTLLRWWYCLFERMWSLRGMENSLMDFYLYPEEVHRLFRKLTDFYLRAMERGAEAFHPDGIFLSDDIGTQTGPFFSLEIFRTFFKPYYKELIEKAHELGMHFWLHTCGNIELFLPDFIEIGLDVIHPIQKYTMEEKKIAETYGKGICILAGFDVQHTIPFGSPEEVRAEVRHLTDIYDRPEGRLMLTMGNGSTVDWKLESLEALYEETLGKG